jgi:hypothetical protein
MPSARRAFPRQAIPVVLGRASAHPGGALTGAFRQATEQPRILDRDWRSYRTEIYRQRDKTNEIREKKKLPLETGPIFYHETVDYFYEQDFVYEG